MHIFSLLVFCGFMGPGSSCSAHNDLPAGRQDFEQERKNMVESQIQARGIKDTRVLNAMLRVKRHLFVPEGMKPFAYDDTALPIDKNQTISQPYIVALMTELANIGPEDKVLEIGTGSGYQAAILAELSKEVYSMEIIKELADESKKRLEQLGYRNIEIKHGDGYQGWPQAAPFDAIIVTAAAKEIPDELMKELKPGGRMVIPLGRFFQELYCITKNPDGSITKEHIIPVRFVPMVRGDQKKNKK